MSAPLRVAVLGATGRMGRLILQEAASSGVSEPLVAAVARSAGEVHGVPVRPISPTAFGDAELVIDFSLPEALEAALGHIGHRALVTGTTGLAPHTLERLVAHSAVAPVLAAANFSTGINVLLDLVGRAAAALPDYHVEIVETHHEHKRDAPSGTALALGEAIADARHTTLDSVARHGRLGEQEGRPREEIAFHALRGGDVAGEHTVWLLGHGERVSLGHVASSRATFARGALRAARWLHGRSPGRYSMADVLGLSG